MADAVMLTRSRAGCRSSLPLDIFREPLHRPHVGRLFFPSLLLLLPACSPTRTAVSVDVTAGQETAAFVEAPAVSMVAVTVTSLDGTIDVTATGAPAQTFDFGDFDEFEQITVTLDGTAESGQVMGGQTLPGLLLSTVVGDIPVFAQRKGQWSRPLGGLAASHVNGVATVIEGRYLALTGGTAATGDPTSTTGDVDAYDLFGLGGDATSTFFSTAPQTIVAVPASTYNPDSQALILGSGSPELYDYTQGADNTDNAPLSLPTGMTAWTDVTGGAVLSDGKGRAFVVGATRGSGATTAVLAVEVDADGDVVLTDYPLIVARAGAAAAYIEGVGLVVAGGSSMPPGVEVLSPAGAAFVAQGNSPADPVAGAGAVTDGGSGLVLIGGVEPGGAIAPTRHLELTNCTAGCAAAAVPGLAMLPIALVNVSAYPLGGQRSLAVGTQLGDGGLNRSFIVDIGALIVTEALLREPRQGASVIPAPNATLAVLGGEHADGTPALSVELFLP
jgi:hypothetical protein